MPLPAADRSFALSRLTTAEIIIPLHGLIRIRFLKKLVSSCVFEAKNVGMIRSYLLSRTVGVLESELNAIKERVFGEICNGRDDIGVDVERACFDAATAGGRLARASGTDAGANVGGLELIIALEHMPCVWEQQKLQSHHVIYGR